MVTEMIRKHGFKHEFSMFNPLAEGQHALK